MRIDKIIDRITKIVISPEIIKKILVNKVPFRLKILIFLISVKKKILLIKKGSFQGLKNIEGLNEYNISKESFDGNLKKDGISAMVRLKNGDDFLEKCLLSIIDYVDEIILLVDINSTDKTNEICLYLSNKYPNKCKYFAYVPVVYPGNHEKYAQTPDNSVHSLSYFYNYCMSKVNYKYVMKFDDDMLSMNDKFESMCNFIKKNKPLYFLALPQINLSKNNDGEYAIANKFFQSGIAGGFGDHGIFPISLKTYFFNDIGCENLITPYKIKYGDLCFFHLKNLKSDGGMKNYSGYGNEYIKMLNKNSSYIPLPDIYKIYLNTLK